MDRATLKSVLFAKNQKVYAEFHIKDTHGIPKDVLRKAIYLFRDEIKNEENWLGRVCYINSELGISGAVCVIEEILDDFTVKVEVLNTPMGRLVRSILLLEKNALDLAFQASGVKNAVGVFEKLKIRCFVVHLNNDVLVRG